MATLSFPNGFESWHESHFEIIDIILRSLDNEGSHPHEVKCEQGVGGLYQLAYNMTDQFEQLHIGRIWDGEFFDEVEKFADAYFQKHQV